MNITSLIEKAAALDINWKHFDFHNVKDTLAHKYVINIEFEEEKIAVLSLKNTIVGYLCLDYPIFFIENEYYADIHSILNQFDYIQYINVENISKQSLSVNPEIYNKYFYYFENMDRFSAEYFYSYNI